tara:strand:- start:1456 stop:12243 length:10788 start_codon:yes stop_codon:yes gene_type:complete
MSNQNFIPGYDNLSPAEQLDYLNQVLSAGGAETAEPLADQQGWKGDLADMFQRGAIQGAGGLFSLAEEFTGYGGSPASYLQEQADKQLETLSPEGKEALSKELFRTGPDGLELGDGLNPRTMSLLLAQGAGTLAPTIAMGGGAGLLARGVGAGAKVAGAASTAGFGVAGGSMAQGMAGQDAASTVLAIPDEQLYQTKAFTDLWNSDFYDEAIEPAENAARVRNQLAENAASTVMRDAKLAAVNYGSNFVVGGVLQGLKTGALASSRLGNAAIGGVSEATEEFVQEGASALAVNEAARQVDPTITDDNVLPQALTGAVVGFGLGAPLGLAGRVNEARRTTAESGGDALEQELSASEAMAGDISSNRTSVNTDFDIESLNEQLRAAPTDYSQFDTPIGRRDPQTGRPTGEVVDGIDGDIEIMRQAGDKEAVDKLTRAKKILERAFVAKQAGREGMAKRLYENGAALYEDVVGEAPYSEWYREGEFVPADNAAEGNAPRLERFDEFEQAPEGNAVAPESPLGIGQGPYIGRDANLGIEDQNRAGGVIVAGMPEDYRQRREQKGKANQEAYEGQFAAPDDARINAGLEAAAIAKGQARDAGVERVAPELDTPQLDAVRAQGLDDRFANPEYRERLPVMANELVQGGGIALLTDDNGAINGRTKSQNPDWFKNNGDLPSIGFVKAAVNKALEGKKLGPKQVRAISAMMDAIDADRDRYDGPDTRSDWESLFDEAAFRDSVDPDAESTIDNWIGDSGAYLFDAGENAPLRTVAMLWDEALDRGVSQSELESIDKQTDTTESLASAIYERIKGNTETVTSRDNGDGRADQAQAGSDAGEIQSGTESEQFNLAQQTEQELAAQAAAQSQAEQAEAKQAQKAEVDKDVSDFNLTGSDRAADVAAARGQTSLLDASSESQSTQSEGQSDLTASSAPQNAGGEVRGEKLNDEWTAFSDASGTKNIPRSDMPQVKAEHRGALANFLKARGIAGTEETVAASELKPTQAEFSETKVQKAKGFEGGDRAILVSKDNHVVDGHHQWMAKRDNGEDVRVIRLDAPIDVLLEQVKEFPSAEQAGGKLAVSADVEVGEISSELSKIIRRQAAPIVLQDGDKNYGRRHIEERHGEEIRGEGYSVDSLVEAVASGFNTIYRASAGQLLLAKKNGKDKIAFIQLTPSDSGDVYRVNSAFFVLKRYLGSRVARGEYKLLWDGSAAPSETSSEPPTFARSPKKDAGQDSPNESQRNSKGSVSPESTASQEAKPAPDEDFPADNENESDADQETSAKNEGDLTDISKDELPTTGSDGYTVDHHKEIFKTITEKGDAISVADVKAAFESLVSDPATVKKVLNKLTIKELTPIARPNYSGEKKASLVDMAFKKLIADYEWLTVHEAFMTSTGGYDLDSKIAGARKRLDGMTSEDLRQYSADRKAAVAERKAQIDAIGKAVKNPETLEDFEIFIQYKGKDKFSTEQLRQYDALKAGKTIEEMDAERAAKAVKSGLDVDEELGINPIEESVHGKTGEPIFNVSLQTRLGKEKFKETAGMARSMGGGYWKGNFYFKSREDAELFTGWLQGENVDNSEKLAERQADKQDRRVSKLRELAEKTEAKANEKLNADRQTNTARRARMAASAEESAAKDIEYARILRNVANAVDEGNAPFLANLSATTQLSELLSIKRLAIPSSMRNDPNYDGYSSKQGDLKAGITVDDYAPFIEMPRYAMSGEVAVNLGRDIVNIAGLKRIGDQLIKEGGRSSGKVQLSADAVTKIKAKVGNYYTNKYGRREKFAMPWQLERQSEQIGRLERMGITTGEHLRAAIRELDAIEQSSEKVKLDPLRDKERALVGKKIAGFFPTPEPVVERLLDEADIQPGMTVLEPSAGKGDIADAIREANPDAELEVVEIDSSLRELLTAKGYEPTGRNFLEQEGEYDRIVMNPPFEKNADIEHVRHAYSLLKPGGRLVAVTSGMAGHRSDKVNTEFKEWVETIGGTMEQLPDGSFKSSFRPTGVSTQLVVMDKPEILYSRSATKETGATPKGVGLGSAKIAINKFLKQYKGANDVTIKVFRTHEEAHGSAAPFRTKGGYDPESDTLFIYTEALDSIADLEETLQHELLVHKGLGFVDPATLSEFLTSLRNAAKDSPELEALYNEVERVEDGRSDALKAEEILARIAQDRLSFSDKVWNRIVLAVQRLMNRMFGRDISARRQGRDLVYRIGEAFADGRRAGRRETSDMFNQSVYHGTGHDFDNFSLDAIGSGEGAQSYGWGLYFAGKRAVAEYYRNNLANKPGIEEALDRYGVSDSALAGFIAEDIVSKNGDLNRVADNLEKLKYPDDEEWFVSNIDRSIELLRTRPDIFGGEHEGYLYQADIPEDSELLDYDSPITKQSQPVRDALKKLPKDVADQIDFLDGVTSQETDGGALYDLLIKHAGSSREASILLNDLGIPGLRYSDAGSRIIGGKDGTYNYVIWDESRVTVEAVNDELRQAETRVMYSRDDGPESPAWKAAKAKGLDMSKEARMQRARDMGFDTDRVYYHGTKSSSEIDSLRTSQDGMLGKGVYITDDIGKAEKYAGMGMRYSDGGSVYPLYIKDGEIWDVADKGFPRDEFQGTNDDVVDELSQRGFIGIKDGKETVLFDPANIRSVNAAFDPDEADSSNLMYSRTAELDPNREVEVAPRTAYDEAFDSLGNKDKTVFQRAKQALRREFTAGGLLPKDVFKAKIDRDAKLNGMEFDITKRLSGFEHSISTGYGKPFDKLSDAEKVAINESLGGSDVNTDIPEVVREEIIKMRTVIKSLSKEYAAHLESEISGMKSDLSEKEQGIFNAVLEARKIEPKSDKPADKAVATKKQNEIIQAAIKESGLRLETGTAMAKVRAISEKAALLQTVLNNLDTYVHRSYRAFDDPTWPKKVPREVFDAAAKYLEQQYAEGGDVTSEIQRKVTQVIELMLEEGTAFDSLEGFIKESKLGAKDLSVLQRRKQIAPEIRALLGEYTDPKINFTKSVTKMSRLVMNQKFLDRVKELGLAQGFLFTEENRPLDATRLIAADGSEVYAPLNGYYTYPEIDQAFKDVLGKEQMGDLMRTIIRWNGMVKYGKTVLSPTTAFRNWMSAAFFAMANGHFDLTQMRKSLSSMREYFTHQEGKDGYLRKLKELGVIYDTPYAGEMMDLLSDSQLESSLFDKKPFSNIRKANEYAQKFYQYGDDFWKIIGYENEKAMLIKHKGLSEADAELEAAERIRNTYPTYSMTGRAVQRLRRFPLAGTFVSFPAEIIRTSFHMLRYLREDMKTSPAYARRKIAGLALASAGIYGIQALSMAMMGMDDDEEEAFRDMAPEWAENSNLMALGRNEKGQIQVLDMSFLDPYNYWKRPINAILRGQPMGDMITDSAREMLQPFFGQDIAFGAIMEAVNNKKGSGGQVFNPDAPVVDQTVSIVDHLRKALQPGFVNNIERMSKALSGDVSNSGKEYKPGEEVAAFFGFRPTTFDPKIALYYRSFEFKDEKSNATKIFTSAFRNPNKVSESRLNSAVEDAKEAHDESFEKMFNLVSAARKAGLTQPEIIRILRQGGVGKKDAFALATGRTPVWRPPTQSMKYHTEKAGLLFDQERAEMFRERRKAILSLPNQDYQ